MNRTDSEILKKIDADRDAVSVDINPHRFSKLGERLLIFTAGVAFAVFVWWAVSWYYNTFIMDSMSSGLSFPDPISSFQRLIEMMNGDYLIIGSSIFKHTGDSLLRWVQGFTIAFVGGTVLGIALSVSPTFYRFGIVPVSLLQMIPGMAWFPVTILLFGFSNISAVYIIAITVIAPITINVCNGLRRVPEVNKRVANMCGRTITERYLEVMIPFALLDILAGLRIGMANGWRVLISAEMVVGLSIGLGYSIKFTSTHIDYVTSFACIIMICIIGIIIDKVILANLELYGRKKLGFEE
jgi:ABC-type nitrate/sulfonate/bicarbonate transport system permease component